MFLLIEATTAYRCAVSYTFGPIFACCFFVIENGLVILLWTANWKARLLTLSRVHPKYFRSFNKRYSTSFSLRAE
jgi:hypothetical protein